MAETSQGIKSLKGAPASLVRQMRARAGNPRLCPDFTCAPLSVTRPSRAQR